MEQITLPHALVVVVLVALLVRLLPNLLLPVGAGYDIESYQIVGNLVLRGEDVYTSQEALRRHPYLPCQMYWMALSLWLSQTMHLPFVKVVRLNPILFDVGIAATLVVFFRRRSVSQAFQSGLLYALNPVPVLVSAYHGQFDAVPAFFLLLSIGLVQASPFWAGACLGMGILIKSWPGLGLPSLMVALPDWRQRLRFLLASALFPAIGITGYTLFFNAPVWTVIERAISYNWGVGVWGYTYFFHLLSVLKPESGALFAWLVRYGRYLTLLALGLIWLWRARREPVSEGVLKILVAFFAVTHAFSIQYLMWVVPFALLVRDRGTRQWLFRYSLAVFCYMFLTYATLILTPAITEWLPWNHANTFIIRPSALPGWFVTVFWLADIMRKNCYRG
ncbi:MAG: glycosyltransferase 87 family protein [Anaerolineae bacterium]